jgi:hypothetical protein
MIHIHICLLDYGTAVGRNPYRSLLPIEDAFRWNDPDAQGCLTRKGIRELRVRIVLLACHECPANQSTACARAVPRRLFFITQTLLRLAHARPARGRQVGGVKAEGVQLVVRRAPDARAEAR